MNLEETITKGQILGILETEIYPSIYYDGEPYAVVEGREDAAEAIFKLISPAIGGEAVPRTSVAPGPEASPELITFEALEKEGWESLMPAVALKQLFYKHPITVQFIKDKLISVSAGNIAFDGCKSMPDLRTLTRLVNGE